ncbi:hypothetical protein AALP_AA5G081100 [Arabis alpina]|uniref:TOG domain-containing protein n=1 Tax=Arabis alpina TaxID=50452 RepID=A0A087GVN6_ARAAL|nr:hypothetical protein AALP_AA5G081100 [Arabis alpina]
MMKSETTLVCIFMFFFFALHQCVEMEVKEMEKSNYQIDGKRRVKSSEILILNRTRLISDMSDALSVVPAAVHRNLSDKLYEKRKNAALDLENIVKSLTSAGDHDKISKVIEMLIKEFAKSPQPNHRKGVLIGLAAVTVGLSSEAAQYLEQIVPTVINSVSDQDSQVRYYACEALYNIAKAVRGELIIFFIQIFDALCKLSADSDANVQSAAHLLDRLIKDIVMESDQFSIEEFIPLLKERMNVLNPHVQQFRVGWITVLDSVPDIDMLGFLPDFLDGLYNMLSDSSHEIRQHAKSVLFALRS